MKRLETKEELEKKSNRQKALFSYIVLGILLVSSIGYAFLSGEKSTTNNSPNGEYGGRYYANVSSQQISFENSPADVKNISADVFMSISSYFGKPLYIVSKDNQIAYEIASTLGKYTERAQMACYENCTENLPEKTCDDNLIIWSPSNQSSVHQEKNCVFIEGDMKAVDAFLYKVLGLS